MPGANGRGFRVAAGALIRGPEKVLKGFKTEPMAQYQLSWITDSLAMGHAPMSFTDLDSIREQGVQTIMNLCGEFCDLHEIEDKHGFEVYYLPLCDNAAPSEPELEKALDWLDEAIYLGKKVLVHCRYGVGRTATFVAAYLLSKGIWPEDRQEKSRRSSFDAEQLFTVEAPAQVQQEVRDTEHPRALPGKTGEPLI